MKTVNLLFAAASCFLFASCAKESLVEISPANTPENLSVASERGLRPSASPFEFSPVQVVNNEPFNNAKKDASEVVFNGVLVSSDLGVDDFDWWKVKIASEGNQNVPVRLIFNTQGLSPVKLDLYTSSGAHIQKYIIPTSSPNTTVVLPAQQANTFTYLKVTQLGTAQEGVKAYTLRFRAN